MSGAKTPRRSAGWGPAAALLLSLSAAAPAVALDPVCADVAASAPFVGVDELRAWHQVMADLGPRPTASSAHRSFLRWLRKRLHGIRGIKLRSDRYPIVPRQLERSATLSVVKSDGTRLVMPTAGPIPYADLTRAQGLEAPLVYLPPDQAITPAAVAGRIVVRELTTVGVPYSLLQVFARYWYDPLTTLAPDALYERAHLSGQTESDIRAASAAGAAGLVMIQEFPRAQIAGQYHPYEGVVWTIPGVFLGVDEGRALIDLVQSATAQRAVLTVRGSRRKAPTWNLIAKLPGMGPEKIVVASHTDGMNPIWDNGPLAMLALARYFASLPVECRPRSFEFAFTTAHLYLSEHGAERYGESLVPECDTIALVVVLEHLGANEFLAVPRTDGPGRMLVPSGLPEFTFVFATPTAALLDASMARVADHDLQRVAIVPFTSGIANGEGKSYDPRGFPTLAAIAGPWTLWNPAFGMETVNVDGMRNMTLAFRDMILDLQNVPRALTSEGRPCHSITP